MIIDAHIHMGTFDSMNGEVDMSKEVILKSMEKYNVDFCLVSNINGIEAKHDGNICDEKHRNQIDVNEEAIAFAKRYPNKLAVLLWARPLLEGEDSAFEQLIKDNLDVVKGIKVHPLHSKLEIDDAKMEYYINLCDKYNLPMMIHTANTFSHPQKVYEVAKKYSSVNFVMGHMGLGMDHTIAAKLMAMQPNLYGDTAWVEYKKLPELFAICGEDKILFGSDSPIDGLDTYGKEFYVPYFTNDLLSPQQARKLFVENVKKVYKIL